jgi:hypothetical protein
MKWTHESLPMPADHPYPREGAYLVSVNKVDEHPRYRDSCGLAIANPGRDQPTAEEEPSTGSQESCAAIDGRNDEWQRVPTRTAPTNSCLAARYHFC